MFDVLLMFLLMIAPPLVIHRLFGTSFGYSVLFSYVPEMLAFALLFKFIRRRHLSVIRKWATEQQVDVISLRNPDFADGFFKWRWWRSQEIYSLTTKEMDDEERRYFVSVTGVLFTLFILDIEVEPAVRMPSHAP